MMRPRRVAFYPCCGDDISAPRCLLSDLVDEIIYCDLRKPKSWEQELGKGINPKVSFVQKDVREVIADLPTLGILFYRRDSPGEGGSGIYILGKQWLEEILAHFPSYGGFIITDGSNSGSGLFRKMIRPCGYTRALWAWHFQLSDDQPWLESLGLCKIKVTRAAQQGAPGDALKTRA